MLKLFLIGFLLLVSTISRADVYDEVGRTTLYGGIGYVAFEALSTIETKSKIRPDDKNHYLALFLVLAAMGITDLAYTLNHQLDTSTLQDSGYNLPVVNALGAVALGATLNWGIKFTANF